jgi:D-sedoheptulose 7-phosphate isomerase
MSNTEVNNESVLVERLEEAIATLTRVKNDGEVTAAFSAAVEATIRAVESGGRVLLCGNGGSSADSQHFAAELVGKFMLHREPWSAISLSDNVAAITAIGNDYVYADVFARAVKAHGRSGDVLIGFSTSGESANVVAAFDSARQLGITSVAFVGPGGSPLSSVADIAIHVDGPNTARIQEGHKVVGHALFEIVEQRLVDSSGGSGASS